MEQLIGETHQRQPDPDIKRSTHGALRAAARRPDGMAGLASRHLRWAPWVILEAQEGEQRPLAADRAFLDAYLGELARRARASAITTLTYCFLYVYPVGAPFFDPLRRALRDRLLPLASTPRGERWRACVQQCGLLDEDAPARLALRLRGVDGEPQALLEACCLRGLPAQGGLVREALRQWLGAVSQGLAAGTLAQEALARMLAFAGPAPERGGTLRFDRLRVALADGLLLPFADGHPTAEHQERIKAFLLDAYGDPRLDRGRRWQGVDERARQVMLRWLVETTLEDFFRLLEHAARPGKTAAGHWRYRQAFWSAYLRAGHIADAWVALGPRARAAAKGFLAGESGAYGTVSGYGVQSDQSVLLLRVGDLTITEWSHSGKYRLWLEGNPQRPRLYARDYTRDAVIRGADEEGAHHGSERGTWQGQLADLIRHYTAISVHYRDYMPRS